MWKWANARDKDQSATFYQWKQVQSKTQLFLLIHFATTSPQCQHEFSKYWTERTNDELLKTHRDASVLVDHPLMEWNPINKLLIKKHNFSLAYTYTHVKKKRKTSYWPLSCSFTIDFSFSFSFSFFFFSLMSLYYQFFFFLFFFFLFFFLVTLVLVVSVDDFFL